MDLMTVNQLVRRLPDLIVLSEIKKSVPLTSIIRVKKN